MMFAHFDVASRRVKRLIGLEFSNPQVQHDLRKVLKYPVLEDKGRITIPVNINSTQMLVTPEHVSAAILSKMKQLAEAELGGEVRRAVITVSSLWLSCRCPHRQPHLSLEDPRIRCLRTLTIVSAKQPRMQGKSQGWMWFE